MLKRKDKSNKDNQYKSKPLPQGVAFFIYPTAPKKPTPLSKKHWAILL